MTSIPMPVSLRQALSAGLVFVAACGSNDGGGTEPPPAGEANCSAPAIVQLAAGQHQVMNATSNNGCIRFPAPGGSDAEYLYALVSGSGQVTPTGVSGPYAVRVGAQGAVSSPPAASSTLTQLGVGLPERFHLNLRERERALAATAGTRPNISLTPPATVPPQVGTERTFAVCKNTDCNQFDSVTAVARSVGVKVAVYLDKTVPSFDSLTQADLDDLKRIFDTYHYPIDTNAFGTESDQDNNGVVIILLTDAVNALTPNCAEGRILGYFYGGDLLNTAGSNHAEVFYAMVPAPASGNCTAATRERTLLQLKPTLIHEFQHMISFNQHVLVRNGSAEETWLNEALSHFAEELGGRLIPNVDCVGSPSCRSQYASGDLLNAYDYMQDTEANYLVFPDNSTGGLEERGAAWLFVTWLIDQYGTDDNGTNVSRGLVQTSQLAPANIEAVSGQPFATLVGEWMLALYTDDLPGFTPQSEKLTFSHWGFRSVFELNCCAANKPFPQAFPFTPINTTGAPTFLRTGTLRGGSGLHFSATLPAGSNGLDVLFSKAPGGDVLDASLVPRVSIVRLR